jgi:maleamate amidohydrolase
MSLYPEDNVEADLQQNYVGAFDGRLPFGKHPALLVVDVVIAYLTPGSPLFDQRFIVALASNERLVAAARAAAVPVIFTNVVYQPGGADGGIFYRKVPALSSFDRGSPMGNFPESLQPRDDETIVSKQYASAFFGTSLSATLTAQGIDMLLITGFSTSGCVRATALDAMQHGFLPFVVREACGDRHDAPHEANLFDLQAKYAEVIDEAGAVAFLAERSVPAKIC